MSEEFDGYRKWLGIPPEEQPPNHYRLLGIAAFEDDPDVISNAADRQMSHIRTYQSGKHGDLSQKILNELSAAKVALLSEEKKSTYDEQLRQELAKDEPEPAATNGAPAKPATPPPGRPKPSPPPPGPAASPPPPASQGGVAVAESPSTPTPIPVSTPASAPVSVSTPSRSTSVRVRRRKSSPLPLVITICAVLGLIAIGAFAALVISGNAGKNNGSKKRGDSDAGTSEVASKDDDSSSSKPDDNNKPKDRDKPPRRRPGLDGNSGSNGNDPVMGNLPQPGQGQEKSLEEVIGNVRSAMAERDLSRAREQIALVDALKPDDEQSPKAERTRELYDLYSTFWQGVYIGAEKIEPGDELGFRSSVAEFVSKDGDNITYRRDGNEETRLIKQLKVTYLVSLAQRGMVLAEAEKKNAVAAFLALDGGSDDNDQQLEYAKKLYREAAAAGETHVHLAGELGIDPDDMAVASVPPDEPEEPIKPTPVTRRPVAPPLDELRAARLKVNTQYRAQAAAANTSSKKEKLIEDLVGASERTSDKVLRYAILEATRDVTVELGIPDAVTASIDALAVDYDIDLLREKATYLGKTLQFADNKETVQRIADLALELKDEAEESDNLGAAAGLSQVALAAGRALRDVVLIQDAEADLKKFDEYLKEQKKVDRAKQRLDANPDDPTANFAVGKFICFYDNDWPRGLPLLAKGSDVELGQLAEQELAETKSPEELKEIADEWLALARREGGLAGKNIQAHAAELYRQALPGLEGPAKEAVGERLRELSGDLID